MCRISHGKFLWIRGARVAFGWLVCAIVLAGCAAASTPQQDRSGGFSPESVAQSFFEDLRQALQDPNLRQAETRSIWAERLAGYFAPVERDDQRVALSRALAAFATDLGQLAPDEAVVFELRGFERVEKISDDGQRAVVRLPAASIYMALMRMTDRGPRTFYEQTIGLDRVTGRADGSVPMINIDGRWYLTEG